MISSASAAYSGRRALLLVTGYGALGLLGWSNVSIPTLVRSVEHDLAQTDVGMSLYYFLSASLMTVSFLGGGLLTERLGRRRILVTGACLSGIGFFLMAATAYWPLFVLGGCLAALGAGFIDPLVIGLFLDLYPNTRGAALNVLNAFYSIGSLAAPAVIGMLVSSGVSWRAVMVLTSVAYLVLLSPLLVLPMPTGRRVRSPVAHGADVARSRPTVLPFVCLAVGIALYTGAMTGVSSWLVRFLATVPLAQATLVLSAFWAGQAVARLVSSWVVERHDYSVFVVICIVVASLSLAGATLSPWFPVAAALFALSGISYGPVFPIIMAIGGSIYPNRVSTLTGSLMMAGGIGVIIYPPLMGLLANRIGLQGGMLGAAALGIPIVVSIFAARSTAQQRAP